MAKSYLLAYTSREGQTKKIANEMKQTLESQGHSCELVSLLEQSQRTDLSRYDFVILGGSIHYGNHEDCLTRFIQQNRDWLEENPSAFFSVNLTARKPEKNQPDNNPYLMKFLKKVGWHPRHLAVFAGALLYPQYTWYDRMAIRFIMWITDGVTDTSQIVEYTDWEKVRAFADSLNDTA